MTSWWDQLVVALFMVWVAFTLHEINKSVRGIESILRDLASRAPFR